MAEYRAPQIRTFELLVPLTGWPKSFPETGVGKMDDLPANIQDKAMAALEAKSKATGLPLSIIYVRMDVDHDKPVTAPDRVFLHLIASEVVAINTAGTRH